MTGDTSHMPPLSTPSRRFVETLYTTQLALLQKQYAIATSVGLDVSILKHSHPTSLPTCIDTSTLSNVIDSLQLATRFVQHAIGCVLIRQGCSDFPYLPMIPPRSRG